MEISKYGPVKRLLFRRASHYHIDISHEQSVYRDSCNVWGWSQSDAALEAWRAPPVPPEVEEALI